MGIDIFDILNQPWFTNVCSFVMLIVALSTLCYTVKSNREFMKKVEEQIDLLRKQVDQISKQTELLRKQVFGEIWEEPQIKDLRFYLPERRKHSVKGFEKVQKVKGEIPIGSEIKIPTGKEVELHLQWWMQKGQHLRIVSIGFLDEYNGVEYEDHPEIIRLTRSFIKERKGADFSRVVKDWHGHWTIEYLPPRYIPEDEVLVLSFDVIGKNKGKYPLAVHIAIEEAPKYKKKVLWVEVVEDSEFEKFLQKLSKEIK